MQVNLTERLVLATTDDGSNNNSTTTTGDPQRARHYYDLVSVVVHIGAAHDEGHFVCVVRCGPPGSAADSAWTLFDDGRKPCRLADFDAVQRRYASHDCIRLILLTLRATDAAMPSAPPRPTCSFMKDAIPRCLNRMPSP